MEEGGGEQGDLLSSDVATNDWALITHAPSSFYFMRIGLFENREQRAVARPVVAAVVGNPRYAPFGRGLCVRNGALLPLAGWVYL